MQAQATETIHALQTRLYQVDGEKQDLTQDVGELQAQHKQLQIHNNQLESEKKQLMTQNTHLKEDKTELQILNNQLETQNVALVSQLKEEQQQIEQLKTQLTNLEEAKVASEQTQEPEQKAETSPGAENAHRNAHGSNDGELELYTSIQKLKDELNQVCMINHHCYHTFVNYIIIAFKLIVHNIVICWFKQSDSFWPNRIQSHIHHIVYKTGIAC